MEWLLMETKFRVWKSESKVDVQFNGWIEWRLSTGWVSHRGWRRKIEDNRDGSYKLCRFVGVSWKEDPSIQHTYKNTRCPFITFGLSDINCIYILCNIYVCDFLFCLAIAYRSYHKFLYLLISHKIGWSYIHTVFCDEK